MAGGPNWVAFGFNVFEAVLTVLGPVWLLSLAQRHLDRRLHWVGAPVSRSAFGAFLVQVAVPTGLAVALRPLPLSAEVKGVLVAGGGVAATFAPAWLLIGVRHGRDGGQGAVSDPGHPGRMGTFASGHPARSAVR